MSNHNHHLQLDDFLYSPLAQLTDKSSSEFFGFELTSRQVMYLQARRNELAMELLRVQTITDENSQKEDLQKRAAIAGALSELQDLLAAAQTEGDN